jgi:hypothetical protein
MIAEFEQAGVRFKYPENWQLEREETDTGWTVTVQSPETAFLMLSFREDMPTTDSMVETALAALREEYAELEADDCVDSVAGQPAVGHDIRFFSLDLTNTCWTRSFYGAQGTLLLLCQLSDLELDKNEPVLRAICASLEVEDE